MQMVVIFLCLGSFRVSLPPCPLHSPPLHSPPRHSLSISPCYQACHAKCKADKDCNWFQALRANPPGKEIIREDGEKCNCMTSSAPPNEDLSLRASNDFRGYELGLMDRTVGFSRVMN